MNKLCAGESNHLSSLNSIIATLPCLSKTIPIIYNFVYPYILVRNAKRYPIDVVVQPHYAIWYLAFIELQWFPLDWIFVL